MALFLPSTRRGGSKIDRWVIIKFRPFPFCVPVGPARDRRVSDFELDHGLADALEPISARGWPPRELVQLGGWRLQASDGFSGRANACWPIGAPDRSMSAAITAVEAWYQARKLAPIFRPADIPQTGPLRQALAEQGYAPRTPTLMMTGLLTPGDAAGVALSPDPDEGFSSVFLAGAPSPGAAAERIDTLTRIPAPRAFARIDRDGAAVAIGAVAIEAGWAGFFGMRTLAEHRRQGLARAVLTGLTDFALAAGATRAYLQVEAANSPAVALYQRLGFRTAYEYRYWERAE